MKNLYLKIYILVLLTQSAAFATSGTMSGSGTTLDPYLVADYADLKAVGITYGLDKVYRLIADIDASASAAENGGSGFTPIGTSSSFFTGTFHGAGHEIKNLSINNPASFIGLFGYNRGTIDSVGLSGVSINGANYTGGLVGQNNGTVNVCYARGSVSGHGGAVGGLIGENYGYSAIGIVTGCYATGSVTAGSNNMVGGLVGSNYYGSVTGCSSTSIVIGSQMVGGLIGKSSSGTVSGCYATGSVTGNSSVGGLVGNTDYYAGGTVSGSYATGSVTGSGTDIGGLVGRNYGSTSGTIIGCYSTGSVTGGANVGGFVGFHNKSTISGSYWNSETSGKAIGIGANDGTGTVSGLTTVQMKNSSNFSGWNFSIEWAIRTDSTYPGLRARDNAPFDFADTITSNRTFWLSQLLLNDCDIETARNNLTLHLTSVSAGTTDSINTLTFPADLFNGTVTTVRYRVGEIRTADTLWGNIASAVITLDTTTTAVQTNPESSLPKTFTLSQNYPNPFNPTTAITFSVGTKGHASLRVYDILGQEVAVLVSQELPVGTYTRQWNASALSSGVYFYKLEAGNFSAVKKLLLLR